MIVIVRAMVRVEVWDEDRGEGRLFRFIKLTHTQFKLSDWLVGIFAE